MQLDISVIINVAMIILGGGITYGALMTRIKNLESKVEATKGDHDLLIVLNSKMDLILKGWGGKKK